MVEGGENHSSCLSLGGPHSGPPPVLVSSYMPSGLSIPNLDSSVKPCLDSLPPTSLTFKNPFLHNLQSDLLRQNCDCLMSFLKALPHMPSTMVRFSATPPPPPPTFGLNCSGVAPGHWYFLNALSDVPMCSRVEIADPQEEVQTPVHGVHASPCKAPAYLAGLVSSACSLNSTHLTPATP